MTDARPSSVRLHASGAVDFADRNGTRWTITEIARLGFSDKLVSLFPHPERREGWLLFESEMGEHRRLAPVPESWRAMDTVALQGCLERAVRPRPHEQRRRDDQI